jgi:IPT/TIG domain-containing protein
MRRPLIFVVQIVWLIALGAATAVYFLGYWPPQLVNLGSVPIGVVWFGALGAVLISLTGIVEHADDWDPRFELWHLSRPLIGAALAVVGVLIVEAGVLAAGTNPASSVPGAPKNLLYYLVAFLVGYREETFRDLVRRLVDLIFTSAPIAPKPTITSLTPDTGPIAGGTAVKILGSGFQGAVAVSFGSTPATFKVDSDTQISAVSPVTATAGAVTVTVKTKGASATSTFTYT